MIANLHQPRTDLNGLAAASLLGAGLAILAQIVHPFSHGKWLISYLLLVGVLGTYLLGRGQAALLWARAQPPAARSARRVQLVLWAVGVVVVPLGVLAEARLGVVVGTISLLVALASFWITVRPLVPPHPSVRRWAARGYLVLLAFLAASAVVGTALAWDIRWL